MGWLTQPLSKSKRRNTLILIVIGFLHWQDGDYFMTSAI